MAAGVAWDASTASVRCIGQGRWLQSKVERAAPVGGQAGVGGVAGVDAAGQRRAEGLRVAALGGAVDGGRGRGGRGGRGGALKASDGVLGENLVPLNKKYPMAERLEAWN